MLNVLPIILQLRLEKFKTPEQLQNHCILKMGAFIASIETRTSDRFSNNAVDVLKTLNP